MNHERSWDDDFHNWLNTLPVWAKLLVFPVVLPFVLTYSMVMMAWFLAMLPFIGLSSWRSHLQFLQQLRDAGRFLSWEEAEARTKAGQGTLVLSQSIKGPIGNAWWVAGRLTLDLENPLPSYRYWSSLVRKDAQKLLNDARPSVELFEQQYLDRNHGTAAWVQMPHRGWERTVQLLPEDSVVVTIG